MDDHNMILEEATWNDHGPTFSRSHLMERMRERDRETERECERWRYGSFWMGEDD